MNKEKIGQIYKITNIINNKIYIGQSKYNGQLRYIEHMQKAYYNPSQSVFYTEIVRYGKDAFKLEILETNVPEKDLLKRERYYIKKTKADDGKNYNINTDAKKNNDNKDKIRKHKYDIYKDLKENKLSYEELSEKYECSVAFLKDVNLGKDMVDNHLNDYPLRPIEYNKYLLTQEELKEIYKRLEEGSTLTDIANKFNVSVQAVGYINSGRNYYDDNRKYPINPNIPSTSNIVNGNKEIIVFVINCLKQNILYSDISIMIKTIFNEDWSPVVISSIDKGARKFDKTIFDELEIKSFPIRKRRLKRKESSKLSNDIISRYGLPV